MDLNAWKSTVQKKYNKVKNKVLHYYKWNFFRFKDYLMNMISAQWYDFLYKVKLITKVAGTQHTEQNKTFTYLTQNHAFLNEVYVKRPMGHHAHLSHSVHTEKKTLNPWPIMEGWIDTPGPSHDMYLDTLMCRNGLFSLWYTCRIKFLVCLSIYKNSLVLG